jgi:hypothetical protein
MLRGVAVVGLMAATLTACDNFFEVNNPNIIDAGTVDPVVDGPTFSRSAYQNFVTGYGSAVVRSAWFTTEMWVGDLFPTRNELGRRAVPDNNPEASGVWALLSRGVATGDEVVRTLSAAPGAQTSLDIARASFSAGYSAMLLAEMFCAGTIAVSPSEPGPLYTTSEMLAAAAERFRRSIDIAVAINASSGEAYNLLHSARVGLARTLLQAGDRAGAAQTAALVPAGFTHSVPYVDDPGSRGRLGNTVYEFSAGGIREALVTPPAYRAMNDPRIAYQDMGRPALDGQLRMFTQRKYPSWAAPIRIASGLEAQYIRIEALRVPADMLVFINQRRTAGGQGPYTGAQTEAALMAELMDQRARDFWLEGKRLGDIRRNPGLVPYLLPPGEYYKAQVGSVGNQTCWDIPLDERASNPRIPL